jgi:hypothetical protein
MRHHFRHPQAMVNKGSVHCSIVTVAPATEVAGGQTLPF